MVFDAAACVKISQQLQVALFVAPDDCVARTYLFS